jgi:putative tryptophan/tyrosine transport system substrate-binding protein
MRRREFVTLLGGAATAWPLASRAQQAAMPVVGYLYQGVPEGSGASVAAAFRKGLGEAGYVEGRNVTIEYRWGQNDPAQLPELAADLVRRRVALIATPGSAPSALAAKALTTTIPIVFSTAADPVQIGLVASLNRPGGNVTGFSNLVGELSGKQLGILHELLPGAVRFAGLVNPNSPNAEFFTKDVRATAAVIGRQIEILTATTNREIDTAFVSAVQKRADALLVNSGALFGNRRFQLLMLAAHHRLPTMYYEREYADAGGLMSYGSNNADTVRQLGIYAARILKGEKPADLPVQLATRFEFIINLHTARTLGVEVPPTLSARADEVIE